MINILFYYTDKKPDKFLLLRFLSSITGKWQEIGDLLGVDPSTIDGLCHSNYSDQRKMSKMLQIWLDNEPTPVTWYNIIDILEGPLQNKPLAIEISKFLGRELGTSLTYYCNSIHASTCEY